MPRREDIRTICIVGSGPIVIGQGCEFDYSGSQACKALRAEGYRVVLLNSNPATIMTDPEMADRTYVEPIVPEVVRAILEREKVDALLPTLGGQTALNVAVQLAESGTLDELGVELIGARLESIQKAEDRQLFKAAMEKLGLEVPTSRCVTTMDVGWEAISGIGYPAILRPSFTMGGSGGSIAYNREEFEKQLARGLDESPVSQVLIEESVLGWKEFELEVMRDRADNTVIVCSIENLDPMGVHTGDSITVAPAQTLTDKEYQRMRDAAIRIMQEVGVDTGGSNVQFAVDPVTGRMVVVEMNPRVSRSSALASKATGFPIAKIAALLAVGYTLDELLNDITRSTPACFEPTIDYVVTKVPRFDFEKFPGTTRTLTTQMKSVGEAMAMGRTFCESLGKALRALEAGLDGLDSPPGFESELFASPHEACRAALRVPTPERLLYVGEAFRLGLELVEIHQQTGIDPWFLAHIRRIVEAEAQVLAEGLPGQDRPEEWRRLKALGLSDRRLAVLVGIEETAVRAGRLAAGVRPVFKQVDTCAAEFAAQTPYLYSTYDAECEAEPTDARKVIVLGGGPNRIGQGIEFDYCCVHAVMALGDLGFETIMVNCNPETVSTDYDVSDRLYFEPLTLEDVLAVCEVEKPEGVIIQFGGQTPLNLALGLEKAGVPIWGTPPDTVDRCEDRDRFQALLEAIQLRQPPNGIARSEHEALKIAEEIGFPVMVRPSYVLGGRAMEVVHDQPDLGRYMRQAISVDPSQPVLIDRFLKDAVELDVDAVSDGQTVVVGGVMEHIEEAGVHSGDSACSLPPYSVPFDTLAEVRRQTERLGEGLGIVGLMNVQFAVKDGLVYVLEVNPRASRTVPFVSKATGQALAKIAARVMAGERLADMGVEEIVPAHSSVKEAVFPFRKFPEVDTLLGPEMRSTGEVMGLGATFPDAFWKAEEAAGNTLPLHGCAFISVRDEDKASSAEIAGRLSSLGFSLIATHGTAAFLRSRHIACEGVNKVLEGQPHIVDHLKNGAVDLVINTTTDKKAIRDSYPIRRETLIRNVPYFTTVAAARAACEALGRFRAGKAGVRCLQEYHP